MRSIITALLVLVLAQAQDVRVHTRTDFQRRLGCEIQKVLLSSIESYLPSESPKLQYAAYCDTTAPPKNPLPPPPPVPVTPTPTPTNTTNGTVTPPNPPPAPTPKGGKGNKHAVFNLASTALVLLAAGVTLIF